MTTFEKWSLFLRAVGVVGTILVLIMAVWGEKIKQLWNRPRLGIRLGEPSLTTANGKKAWYFNLVVSNGRRSSPASNTRVLLERVFKKGPDDRWLEEKFSGPVQVLWQWHDQSPQLQTIGPDTKSPFARLVEDTPAVVLMLYLYPNNLDSKIQQDEPRRLVFRADSDIAASPPITLEVAWDGQWTDGRTEIGEHLVVKRVGSM